MKNRLLYTLLLASLLTKTQAQNQLSGNATVTIDVSNLKEKDGRFYLAGYDMIDSANIENNKIIFRENLKEPHNVRFSYYPNNQSEIKANTTPALTKNYFTFYLTPGNTFIKVKDSIQSSQILNPNTYQKQYIDFANRKLQFEAINTAPLWEKYRTFMEKGPRDSAYPALRLAEIASDKERETIWKGFIEENAATSPVALEVLNLYINTNGSAIEMNKIVPLYYKLNKKFQNFPSAREIKKRIDIFESKTIGKMAPDFTQNDTSGHPVSLMDFRGKYVLIDFWASWCGPCRAENPHVVDAFNKFKNKNFTVLSVSFDKNKDNWLAGIHKDHLEWTHVSDLHYGKNAVGKLFDIHFIPQNILIDPKGIIIAKNIGGKQLEETLTKMIQ